MAHDAKKDDNGGTKLEPLFYNTQQISQLTRMSAAFFEKARTTGKPRNRRCRSCPTPT